MKLTSFAWIFLFLYLEVEVEVSHFLVAIYLFKVNSGNSKKNLFKVNNKDTRTTSLFWCLYCLLWKDFSHCSGVSIVDFEQVSDGWVRTFSLPRTNSSIESTCKFLKTFRTVIFRAPQKVVFRTLSGIYGVVVFLRK